MQYRAFLRDNQKYPGPKILVVSKVQNRSVTGRTKVLYAGCV